MSRSDKIISVALALLLITLSAVGLFFWQQSRLQTELLSAPEDTNAFNNGSPAGGINGSPLISGDTSMIAFAKAQREIAEEWAEDALLVSGSATWPRGRITAAQSGEAVWNFSFYSPSRKQGMTASVADSGVSTESPRPVNARLQLSSLGNWKVDSRQAVEIFMENGGQSFIDQKESVSIVISLSAVKEPPNAENGMTWLIAAVSELNGHSITMWIDATSGNVLETQIVP